jgi:predicted HTH domain antitoxin
MKMTLDLPVDLLININKSLKAELEKIVLLEMWKRGYLSDGKFADLYGITKWELLEMNKEIKKEFYSEEDLARDLRNSVS